MTHKYNENSPRMVTVLQIIYAAAVSNRNNCSYDAMVTVAGAVTICDYHCQKKYPWSPNNGTKTTVNGCSVFAMDGVMPVTLCICNQLSLALVVCP